MKLKTRLEVLSREDLDRVHDASIRILAETGVVFNHEEALETLKRGGAWVDGKRAVLPRKMVESALAQCPRTFLLAARNAARSVTIGDGFAVHPNVGPVFVQDLDGGRRTGTYQDYINFQKLAQASNVVHLTGATPVAPGDVPAGQRAPAMIYAAIRHTDKPLVGSCASAGQARLTLDLVERAMGGARFLDDHYAAAVSINPMSPLAYGREVLETILEYARRRQPIFVLPCILAGVSGPISLYGTVIQQNAEILAGITLIELLNPGNPVVYAPASTAAFMRTGGYVTGPPEAFLINTANLQMALDFYRLPTRVMHGMTDSKEVDCQAGYETMQNMMMGMLSGAHILEECLGVLDSIMTTSYEKWIIDEELLSRVMRICDGLDTSDYDRAIEVIQEVGPGGDFLSHEETYRHMKDYWEPTVSTWHSYQEWQDRGAEDLLHRANRRWKEVLAGAPESMIDSELDRELLKKLGGKEAAWLSEGRK